MRRIKDYKNERRNMRRIYTEQVEVSYFMRKENHERDED